MRLPALACVALATWFVNAGPAHASVSYAFTSTHFSVSFAYTSPGFIGTDAIVPAGQLTNPTANVGTADLLPSCPGLSGLACDEIEVDFPNMAGSFAAYFADGALAAPGTYDDVHHGAAWGELVVTQTSAVPEPSTLALLGAGALAAAALRRPRAGQSVR